MRIPSEIPDTSKSFRAIISGTFEPYFSAILSRVSSAFTVYTIPDVLGIYKIVPADTSVSFKLLDQRTLSAEILYLLAIVFTSSPSSTMCSITPRETAISVIFGFSSLPAAVWPESYIVLVMM